MARARARSRRRYFPKFHRTSHRTRFSLPVGIIAGFLPVATGVWNRRSSSQSMGDFLLSGFTGFTPSTGQWNPANLKNGLLPVTAGFAAHMIASRLGINRALARAGIPIIRI